MKKQTYNQPIYVVWLLINKCLHRTEEHASDRRLTTEKCGDHQSLDDSWTEMVEQPISRHTDQHQTSEFQSGLHGNMAQIQTAILPDAGMNHVVIVLAAQKLRWTRKSIKATTKTWHNMAGLLLCGATAQLSQKSKVHAKPNDELKTEMEVTSSAAAAAANHRHVC